MTFQNALRQMKNGQATKLPTWGGYCKRVDDTIADYNKDTTAGYALNAKVMYMGQCYQCVTAISSGAAAGNFDASKWMRLFDIPHTISFVERSSTGTTYASAATVTASGKTYGDFTPELKLDGELFTAMLSDAWTVGDTEDYDAARTGNARW